MKAKPQARGMKSLADLKFWCGIGRADGPHIATALFRVVNVSHDEIDLAVTF